MEIRDREQAELHELDNTIHKSLAGLYLPFYLRDRKDRWDLIEQKFEKRGIISVEKVREKWKEVEEEESRKYKEKIQANREMLEKMEKQKKKEKKEKEEREKYQAKVEANKSVLKERGE